MELNQMLIELDGIKRKENSLKNKRFELETRIANSLAVEHGKSKTMEFNDKKITVSRPAYYKLDRPEWENIKSQVPTEFRPIIDKKELDKKLYNWLYVNNKEMYDIVSQAVTVSDGKPSVSFK